MNLATAQIDAVREVINIGIGQAAGVLNEMLDSHVVLRVPMIEILEPAELNDFSHAYNRMMLSAVQLGFKGSFSGNASLVFQTESAIKLVSLLTEEDPGSPDLDAMMIGTLTEVGNIVLNGVMGAIGNTAQAYITYSVPNYVDRPAEIIQTTKNHDSAETSVIWVQTNFTIEEHSIDGDLILLFEIGSLAWFLAAIDPEFSLDS
jgi:chemotaxis protein CheC